MKQSISILLASRKKGNPNSDLSSFLDSLAKKTSDPMSIEILIRFDDDDDEIVPLTRTFSSYPFPIKYLIGPRGKGYLDLCSYYNEILPLSNPSFNMVMCVADDMLVLEEKWEQKVFRAAKGAKDLFIIHQWLPNLHLPYEQIPSSLHRVDESPIWSRKLIELTKGIGSVASPSDSWTVTLEWGLKHGYGKSITRYIHRHPSNFPIMDRKLCKEDLHRVETNLLKLRPATYDQVLPKNQNKKTLLTIISMIPEYKQICAIAEYKMGVWPYWNRFYLYFQKILGRIVNNPIDIDGISLNSLDEITYQVEEGYYGYNIYCAGGVYYAIPMGVREFSVAKVHTQKYFPVFSDSSIEVVKRKCSENKLAKLLSLRIRSILKKWNHRFFNPIR